jgi:hypothetical protein
MASILLGMTLILGAAKLQTPFFMVQSAVDSAKLIGLPVSRAVITQNKKMQEPSFLDKEQGMPSDILSWRRVFFRKYFS